MVDKIALAPCNGMSANGLVSRVAVGDCRKENENAISICMGSTSADIEGKNNEMLKKYPIVSVNGCPNGCVNKILEKGGEKNNRYAIIYQLASVAFEFKYQTLSNNLDWYFFKKLETIFVVILL